MSIYQATKRRIGTIPFLLMWLTGHALSWGALYYLWETFNFSDWTMLTISGLILGGGIGLTQKYLLRYAYNIPLKGWMRLTVLGWFAGWLSYYAGTEWLTRFYSYPLWLTIIPMFGIPALFQWFLLRRHVKAAWLWVVAAIVSTITFGMVYDNSAYNLTAHTLSASAQGVVTGLTILWLFGMTNVAPQRQRNVARLSHEYHDDLYDDDYNEDDYQSGHFIQG